MAPHDAITDVAGIKVGHWTNAAAATGCTVVLCEAGAVPGVDVRGGAPGTLGTDLMRPGTLVAAIHAVVLSGGSAFGLATVDGVMRWCEERGVGFRFAGHNIPIATGAILFDLNVGDGDVRPDAAAGYAAAAAASDAPPAQGSVGAGTGATVAKLGSPGRALKGGIGSASESFGAGLVVAAIVAVNAVGEIVDSRDGSVVAGPRGDEPGRFLDTLAALRDRGAATPGTSTMIGVVATNARLTKEQANRLASLAHDGLARAIRPVHTAADGDTVFCLATGERELAEGQSLLLEAFAPLAVERAIVKAVRAATSLAGVPSVADWLSSR